MTRQARRRPILRFVAIVTVLGVVTNGSPLLAATASKRVEAKRTTTSWALQVLNGKGDVVDFESAIRLGKRPTAITMAVLPGDIDHLRSELKARERGGNPTAVARALGLSGRHAESWWRNNVTRRA
jgi:hypothetical protein